MGDEEPELVARRPADVAGLPAAARLGLLHRALHRDRDVADVRPPPLYRDRDRFRAFPAVTEGRWRQHGKGEHVGRALEAHVLEVQLSELGVVGEHDRHGAGRRRAGRIQRSGDGGRNPRRWQRRTHAGPRDDVDPPRSAVQASILIDGLRDAPPGSVRR